MPLLRRPLLYLHSEVVRAIVTSEPNEGSDPISSGESAIWTVMCLRTGSLSTAIPS